MASAGKAILWGGLIAGTLDIAEVCIFYATRGVPPIRILQSIASGVLGRESYRGGNATAALGLGLHFLIAFAAAAVYVLVSRRLQILRRHWIGAGVLYGIAVHLFMQNVVVPMSAFPQPPASTGATPLPLLLNPYLAHIFCVGLPIAWAARKWGPASGEPSTFREQAAIAR